MNFVDSFYNQLTVEKDVHLTLSEESHRRL